MAAAEKGRDQARRELPLLRSSAIRRMACPEVVPAAWQTARPNSCRAAVRCRLAAQQHNTPK
ncbi:hypothetical protein [Saccharibacillus qingshengii]|uniref:hypothetical protein n=1 Tax=Saccharibacillus qingshengii TaxID=1763540 RepID=UPI0015559CC2|nr:hypothetical protein [Saccharibacillus qingshengii]